MQVKQAVQVVIIHILAQSGLQRFIAAVDIAQKFQIYIGLYLQNLQRQTCFLKGCSGFHPAAGKAVIQIQLVQTDSHKKIFILHNAQRHGIINYSRICNHRHVYDNQNLAVLRFHTRQFLIIERITDKLFGNTGLLAHQPNFLRRGINQIQPIPFLHGCHLLHGRRIIRLSQLRRSINRQHDTFLLISERAKTTITAFTSHGRRYLCTLLSWVYCQCRRPYSSPLF